MVPAASLVLLLPFYLGSVVVEYLVLRERWQQAIRERFVNKVMLANAVSYAGLGLYYGAMLWVETRGMGP